MSVTKNVLIGVTVGAILGILYAPDKGTETRRKLSERGKNLRDAWNSLSDAVYDTVEMAREEINNISQTEEDRQDHKSIGNNEHAWAT